LQIIEVAGIQKIAPIAGKRLNEHQFAAKYVGCEALIIRDGRVVDVGLIEKSQMQYIVSTTSM